MATQMLNSMKRDIVRSGAYASNWASLMANYIYEPVEISVIGSNTEGILEKLNERFMPDLIVAAAEKESTLPFIQDHPITDGNAIYICRSRTCLEPVRDIEHALKLIDEIKA